MTEAVPETLSVVVERDIPYPPDRIWRALTQPHLLEAWLMKTDFAPVADQSFRFVAEWGSVDGEVLIAEPSRALSYTWAAFGLTSVVTWTLTPIEAGTRLRMEQSGFKPEQTQFYQGAQAAWPRYMAGLESLLTQVD